MDCPRCGEPDMIFNPGETYDVKGESYTEPDMYSCPDCGHDEIAGR